MLVAFGLLLPIFLLIALGYSIVAAVIALVLLDFRKRYLFGEPTTLTVGRWFRRLFVHVIADQRHGLVGIPLCKSGQTAQFPAVAAD